MRSPLPSGKSAVSEYSLLAILSDAHIGNLGKGRQCKVFKL